MCVDSRASALADSHVVQRELSVSAKSMSSIQYEKPENANYQICVVSLENGPTDHAIATDSGNRERQHVDELSSNLYKKAQ